MWKEGDDTYPVGFGRPPRSTQFRKGQSGNPKGRPRKPSPPPAEDLSNSKVDAITRQIANRSFKVSDGSGTRKITGLEVILQSLFKKAANGSVLAQREFLSAYFDLERRDEAQRRAADQQAKAHFEKVVGWRTRLVKKWAEAEKVGKEPDAPWPHPDDILINERDQTYSIRGPINETKVPFFEYLRTLRDRHMCEVSLILRRAGPPDQSSAELYYCLAKLNDAMLPLHWQFGADAARVSLSIEMMTMQDLKSLIARLEVDAFELHRTAFPFGEEIRFDRDLRKMLKPWIGRIGFRSIKQYERHLEQEIENPPRLK